MASLLLVETRVHNTWKKLLIVKVSYSLCNVDAKIDGNEGPTLISSTRYSFPFEKVVSINMTRYRQLFPTTFSFSRFFFFSSSYLFDAVQVLHTFCDIITEILIIRMTGKDFIDELREFSYYSVNHRDAKIIDRFSQC